MNRSSIRSVPESTACVDRRVALAEARELAWRSAQPVDGEELAALQRIVAERIGRCQEEDAPPVRADEGSRSIVSMKAGELQ